MNYKSTNMAKKITTLDDAKELLKNRKKKPEQDTFDWLYNRQYQPGANIIEPVPIITIQQKTILTMGNYITISGKPKAGKSAFISAIMAGAISGANTLGLNILLPQDKNNLIHLDTEQGEYEYNRSIEMVKKLAGSTNLPGSFKSFRLRGCNAEKIREAITHIAQDNKAGLILIDGLLDTIIDFNNIHECRMITDVLRDITERHKIGIVCIIHQSKSTNYTIGHLGAFADRYSQSVIEVIKDDDVSTLKSVYLRSASNFDPVNITYNVNDNIWQMHHTTPAHHKTLGKDITDDVLIDFAEYLFQNRQYVIYKQISDDAISFLKVTSKQVSNISKRLIELNLIEKTGNNYTLIKAPF